MNRRLTVMAIVVSAFQGGCASNMRQSGSQETSEKSALRDSFLSERFGFIKPDDSVSLSASANLGLRSSSRIQPFRSPAQLREYRSAINTSLVVVNFSLPQPLEQRLVSTVDQALKRSRRLSEGGLAADAALYVGITAKRQDDGSMLIEVLLGVADWKNAQARRAEGPVLAIARSTVWAIISRRKLEWARFSTNDQIDPGRVATEILTLIESQFDSLLFTGN